LRLFIANTPEGEHKRNKEEKGKVNEKFWEERIGYFPSYDTGHIENAASNNSSIVTCVFVTAVTFLSNHCLATIRDTHTDTQIDGRIFLIRPLRWAQVP
jgi:hypothetical protein